MNRLTLKRTSALYGVPWWTVSKDYVVLDEGLIIGRIICGHAGPKDKRWSWIIHTHGPQSVNDTGYSPSRRHAVAAFRARLVAWLESKDLRANCVGGPFPLPAPAEQT
jgi:hypothetical protein